MYNDVVTACEIALKSDKSRKYHFIDNWENRNVLFSGTFYDVMREIDEYDKFIDGDHSIGPVDKNDVEAWALLDYLFILKDIEQGNIRYSKKFLDMSISNVAKAI